MAAPAGIAEVILRADLKQLIQGLKSGERHTRASSANMQQSMNRVKRSMVGAGASATSMRGAMTRLSGTMSKTAAATNAATGATNRFTASQRRANTAARSLLGPLTAGFAVFASFRTLADFSASMAQVGAITKATAADMEALTNKARELGGTTEHTAAQAADAMVKFARAGFSTDETLAAIGDTLDLATAAQLDLASATSITANILRTFQLDTSRTSEVTDILAAAAAAANTDVTLLGSAMKFVGLGAKSVGLSLNNTAAAVAALADAGVVGSAAGTGLRRVMSALLNPSDEAKRVIRGLNIELKDVSPATNEVVDIMNRFHKAGLTFAQSLEIAGQRGGNVLIGLSDNAPRLEELTRAMQNVTGETKRQAELIRGTLANDWKLLISAINEFVFAAGDAGLTSGLRSLLQGTKSVVDSLADSMEQLKSIALGVSAAIAGRLVFALAGARLGFAALTAAITANPFGALALAIGTAVTFLNEYSDATLKVGSVTLRVGEFMTAVWTTITESIKGTGSWILNLATSFGKLLTLDFSGAMKAAEQAGASMRSSGEAIATAWLKAGRGIDVALEKWRAGTAVLRGPGSQGNARGVIPGAADASTSQEAQDKFQEAIDNIKKSTEALIIEAHAMNLSVEAAARYEAQQTLLNEAKRNGIAITPELLASIDRVAVAYERATKAVEENQKAIERADQARETLSNTLSGFFKDISKGVDVMDALTSALGKLADKLIDIAVQNLVANALGPLGSPLGTASRGGNSGGLFGGFIIPGLLHSGGRAGDAMSSGRLIPAGVYAGAPRFHSGKMFGPNEMPAVLDKREEVGFPAQLAAKYGQNSTVVNVINNSGAKVSEQRRRGSGGEDIVDVVISSVNDGMASGAFDGSLRGRFGLQVSPRRR